MRKKVLSCQGKIVYFKLFKCFADAKNHEKRRCYFSVLNADFHLRVHNPNDLQCLMRHCSEDYCALWKPVQESRGPGGQQHICGMPWHSVHCNSPLAPWVIKRPNKWIHQNVCVLLSVCIWNAVSLRRAHSPGTWRKGMPLLAGLMNGWHAVPWQRRMWQPPSPKRGGGGAAEINYHGEIMWLWPPPPSQLHSLLAVAVGVGDGKNKQNTCIILLNDCIILLPACL